MLKRSSLNIYFLSCPKTNYDNATLTISERQIFGSREQSYGKCVLCLLLFDDEMSTD